MADGLSEKKRAGLMALLVCLVMAGASFAGLARCTHKDEPPKAGEPEYTKVTIDGHTYKLELAMDETKRAKGLSERTEIPAEGGMLFVFPYASRQYFVMRDCPVPIDIIFLDGSGRITAFHKMTVEEPRRAGEGKVGEVNYAYEERLKRYSSKYDAQYAIELKGNTLDALNIAEGQQIKIDPSLKEKAK